MKPQNLTEYQGLLTEVIKKLMIMLGPDITRAKLQGISGLVLSPDGGVKEITVDPRLITHQMNDTFLELSGFVVKKTMDRLEKYSEQFTSFSEQPIPVREVQAHL